MARGTSSSDGLTLKSRAARGVLWSALAQGGSIANQVVANVVLARILGPTEFGRFALAAAFAGFAALLVDLGVGPAVLRLDRVEQRHETSAFCLQFGSASTLVAGTILAAPWLARILGEASVADLLKAIAPHFIFLSLSAVPQRLLQRELRVRRIVLAELTGDLIATLLAIIAALHGWGAYALVLKFVGASFLQTTLILGITRWRPRGPFDPNAAKELLGFGYGMTLTTTLNYCTKRIGDLLIGRNVGVRELGFYNRAYAITLQPFIQATQVITRVFIPLMVKARSDPKQLRDTFLRGLGAITFCIFPVCIGLAALADAFVTTIFGQDWLPMVPLLQVFCLTSALNGIEAISLQLLLLQGESISLLRWRIWTSLFTIACVAIGAQWGATGVAAGYAVRSSLLLYFNIAVPARAVGIDAGSVFRAISGVTACGVGMAALVLSLDCVLEERLPASARLVIGGAVGCSMYCAAAAMFRLKAWIDIVELGRSITRRQRHSR